MKLIHDILIRNRRQERKTAKRKREDSAATKSEDASESDAQVRADKEKAEDIPDSRGRAWHRRILERQWETPETFAQEKKDEEEARLVCYRELFKEFVRPGNPVDAERENKRRLTRYGLP